MLITAPRLLLATHWYTPSSTSPPAPCRLLTCRPWAVWLRSGSVAVSRGSPSLSQVKVGVGLPEAVQSRVMVWYAVTLDGWARNCGDSCPAIEIMAVQ